MPVSAVTMNSTAQWGPWKRESAGNRCVECHMPSSPTEVPHVAFTHHRIGIHLPRTDADSAHEDEEGSTGDPQLVSLQSVPGTVPDGQRSRGLAWLRLYLTRPEATRPEILSEANKLLQQAWEGGARDAEVAAGLARIAANYEWDAENEVLGATGPADRFSSIRGTHGRRLINSVRYTFGTVSLLPPWSGSRS